MLGGGKGTPAYAAKSSLGPVVSSATECQNGYWLEFFYCVDHRLLHSKQNGKNAISKNIRLFPAFSHARSS